MHKGMQVMILAVLLWFFWALMPKASTPSFKGACTDVANAARLLCDEKFSLLKATRRDFLVLPGVGPKMADQLEKATLRDHSWRSLDRNVKGLGQKKLAVLKNHLSLP